MDVWLDIHYVCARHRFLLQELANHVWAQGWWSIFVVCPPLLSHWSRKYSKYISNIVRTINHPIWWKEPTISSQAFMIFLSFSIYLFQKLGMVLLQNLDPAWPSRLNAAKARVEDWMWRTPQSWWETEVLSPPQLEWPWQRCKRYPLVN